MSVLNSLLQAPRGGSASRRSRQVISEPSFIRTPPQSGRTAGYAEAGAAAAREASTNRTKVARAAGCHAAEATARQKAEVARLEMEALRSQLAAVEARAAAADEEAKAWAAIARRQDLGSSASRAAAAAAEAAQAAAVLAQGTSSSSSSAALPQAAQRRPPPYGDAR
ncbi:unnamed protein product, partial [Polarella glacialis]